ncbi:MAG: PAS domain S-box protein [Polaromonas sp.]|nr:MAG: PAS domain S-box protein [Polaromonas sp.]
MDSSQLQEATDFQNLQPDSSHTQAQDVPPFAQQGQALSAANSLQPAAPPHHALNAAGRSLCGQQDAQFFNLSLDLLSVASLDEGYLRRVNPAWTTCLGWSATELTSRAWLDFVHPDDHASTVKAHEQLLQGKALYEFENRYRCKDGSHRQLSWNIHPSMDSRELFCIARDVTARRHNDALLRRNDEQFRLMVEGSEQVVFYTRDKAHRFTYLSPSILNVMGYQPVDVIGKTNKWLQIAGDPLNVRARQTLIKTLKEGRAIQPYTIAARHKDGRRLVLEIIESPVFEGSSIASFQGFARDLTERMRTQNELALSELRFRSFFEQAAVGMVVTSETGEFVRVNQRFADIIGYTQEEMVGQRCSHMTHADDRGHEAVSVAQLLDGRMDSGAWEKRYIHKNGHVVWCMLSISMLSMQGDGVRQFICVVEDISEKKRVQENLQRSQAMLRIAGASAKLGGWILETQGNVLHWSDEVRAIHEVAGNFEPALAQALEYYPEDCRDAVMADLKRCQEDGVPFSSEYELTTATGKRVWVLAMGEALRDAQGGIVAVQGALQDITARKQTEASLQASQRRFREIADTFPFIVWTAEPDGRVDYANSAFNDYLGLAGSEEPQPDWTAFVHPEDLPRCLQAWQTSVRTGGVYSIDYRLQEVFSGNYHWFRVEAQAVRDATGLITKWYGSGIDIHETKLLEQQAKSLAHRLSTTLESITDGFLILDTQWRFTFLNTQAERMLGRPRQELLGKTVWTEFPLTVGTAFEQQYRKAVEEGVPVQFQDYYPAPLDRWFATSAYPSDEGLAVYLRDVTQTHKDLAQLQLLRTAVSRLNDIVLITEGEPFDEPGPRIIFVNEAFERRTGYTQAEVIGKTPRLLQGPKTQRAELDRIGKALRAWQPVRGELINYTKSGEEFWLELDIVPIADSKGWFTHWVAVERDITERKMAQEAILRLNSDLEDRVQRRTEQLAAANKELEAFSYSVSHDLRSPLATINGFSQLLLKSQKDQLGEKGQHYLNRIYAGSTKMGELIEGLLSLARLSRGDLNRQDVDLTAMAAKMVRELRDAEPDRVVDVTIQADLVVNGDAAMVTVVMQNLVANAWKYSGRTPQARVDIGSETTPDGMRCIFVRDNGAGFDMAYAEKLFQVFQRLHQDTEFKGTGIGLANVKRVVERHGGRVWAQAAVGKGATFRFTLD